MSLTMKRGLNGTEAWDGFKLGLDFFCLEGLKNWFGDLFYFFIWVTILSWFEYFLVLTALL